MNRINTLFFAALVCLGLGYWYGCKSYHSITYCDGTVDVFTEDSYYDDYMMFAYYVISKKILYSDRESVLAVARHCEYDVYDLMQERDLNEL